MQRFCTILFYLLSLIYSLKEITAMSQDSVILTNLKFAASRIVKLYQYLSKEKHETVISKQII